MNHTESSSASSPSAPRYVRISDRLNVRYQVSGSGPTLVLLHTIRTQLEYFRALVPLLSNTYTVITLDLPGHGFSSVDPSAPFDEPYLRRGVMSFMQALDLRDVTLVGESIGAVLALTVAADMPDRVKAVYAMNPYDYDTRYADGMRRGNRFADVIVGSLQVPVFGAIGAAIAAPWMIGNIMAGGYADRRKMPRDLIGTFHASGKNPGFHLAERRVLAGWRSWGKAREHYARVKAPVTLVYGDKDWSRLSERERTHSLLPDARVMTLANTGHFSSVESPADIARVLLAER